MDSCTVRVVPDYRCASFFSSHQSNETLTLLPCGSGRLPASDFVAVLHPVENATAIEICDKQNNRGDHGENDCRVVFLIPNTGALHGEKVSPRNSSNDRHK